MCETAPSYLYYIYIPTIVMILLLGFVILANNKKRLINVVFFLMIIPIAIWLFSNMMEWVSMESKGIYLFARISILGIITPFLFLLFSYLFSKSIKLSWKKVFIMGLPLLPFILLSATKLNIAGVDTSNMSCNSKLGILYYFIPLLLIGYSGWSLLILFNKIKVEKSEEIKKQIKLIFYGFFVMVLWAIVTNVLAPWAGFDNFSIAGPIGILIFVFFVAYSIVRHQFLNIKLIAAQALTVVVWIIIGSQFLFIKTPINFVLTGFTLALTIVFGIMLIKSVKTEVQRKEELQMMSEKLAQANDQLRKLDNAKTEFISIASHQLRTPLTAIKGFISMLLEGTYGEVSSRVQEVLDKVYLSNERLINLVEDLLNISRIESGRMEYKFEECQMEDILKELEGTFFVTAKDKKMSLTLNLPKELLPKVKIDSVKVKEVISNLIDNAFKYTKRGGVKVSAELIESSKPQAASGKGVIRITVSDTGIGIPPEELPYLFSKFSRGKDTSRLHATGTGLGLYVGKLMIEAHQGKIWAKSDGQDKGSRFIVELPVGVNM